MGASVATNVASPLSHNSISFVVPIFFRFCSNQQFLTTKTTIVVFKQHDLQNVTEAKGVAGGPLWRKSHLFSWKNSDFWGFPVVKGSPSSAGEQKFLRKDFFLRKQAKKSSTKKSHLYHVRLKSYELDQFLAQNVSWYFFLHQSTNESGQNFKKFTR